MGKDHKYYAGLRVKVYATLGGAVAETLGVVLFAEPRRLKVKLDTGVEIYAHPKQVRRIKKKFRPHLDATACPLCHRNWRIERL